ncbi:MAG: DNA polymerase III subunit alpha [Deltaproteobacteria bacterium]|nr:DNA polymerase III subunit alpha [Deltaproteobacteria bacterium]
MKEFVHLHLHSQYSLLDGTIKIKDLVRKVQEMRMPAVALTDHGGMMGTVDFYEKATQAGIRPILGCEIYVAPGSRHERRTVQGEEKAYHLILLAESQDGYRNLIRLVSRAHVEGYYYKPRVDKEILREHGKGLIATSACLQGEIPRVLMQEGPQKAAETLEEYKDIFGGGRFYVEIQDNGLKEQNRANELLVRLARGTGTPLVATNDCHYLEQKDARVHDILLCLQTGKTIGTEGRMRFETDQFYVKSPEEFERAFAHAVPEAITNTLAIAERCRVELDLGRNKIPEFQVPEGMTSEQYLRSLCVEGLARRFREKRLRGEKIASEGEAAYRKRLDFELSVIEASGFSGYFLIVWDFIRHAKEKGIPVGPGRGSAAGSLAAYCLRITEIDPIPYGLLFERFLNPERISLPDVDCDFCKDRRDEVIQYIRERYGEENVTQIITFGTMKARAAVRDVGRVLEMPYAEVDRIAKLIPPDLGMTIDRALQVEPRLRESIQENPKVGELFDYARSIEGLSRHASTHAAGVVIANKPITEYVPLYRNSNGDITTQFSMKDIEKVGLVKFDVLGLRTLTAIHDTLALIRERTGEDTNLETVPLDDAESYAMLGRGDTAGVFQCESGGFTDLLVRLKPERFTHLIHAVALYRPGPLQSGMVDDFIARRHGKKTVEYPFPQVEEILRDTYGVIVYQEQVMQIAVALAGFSMGEADVLRKAMGKKDTALMDRQKERFLKGAAANGIAENKARALFEQIAQFGEYGFNKSHSAAYALVAYQTAWLKAHYPVEYFCALMTSESGDTAKIIRYINHCREKGIPILPPDVNESRFAFFPTGKAIRFGLSAIKGVGEAAVISIQEARNEKPFASVADFLVRIDLRKVNKRALESLIKAGALDSLDPDRGRLFAQLPALMETAQEETRRKESGQFALFGGATCAPPPVRESRLGPAAPGWNRRERLNFEREALGFYITGHPLDAYSGEIGLFANATTSRIAALKTGAEVKIGGIINALKVKTTKRGEKMASLTLEDLEGIVEVVVFPEKYRESQDALASQDPIFMIGRVESDESSSKVIAEEIFMMENVRERLAKSVHIRIDMGRLSAPDIADLRRALAKHPGEKKGYLHLVRDGDYEAVIALPDKFGIAPSLELARALRGSFGYDVLRLH